MTIHQSLSDVDTLGWISRKLEDIEVRSVRQLYARLREDSSTLQGYLKLSDEEFSKLYEKIESLIRNEYPQDMVSRAHPTVNKSGVAVHRLHNPTRPKYNKRG